MPVTRTLAAAFAAATLAAPSAFARPVDMPVGSAQPSVVQHLRTTGAPASWLPHGTQRDPRDLRVVTYAPAQAPLSGPTTSPTHPQPVTAPLTPAGPHDGGIDLATIGLGIAGGVVAVGTIAGITARNRRPQRRRLAA